MPIPELAIVIAAYDEEETITGVIQELLDVLGSADGSPDSIDFEVLVVDDGSRDRTPDICAELAQASDRIRLVRHPTNLGKSAAQLTAALNTQASWILTMDADGQNDPRDFQSLWQAAQALPPGSPTILCGRRTRRADTWLKFLSSRIANGVRRSLLHDETPDTGCGIKLFPRREFLELPSFHNMHRFLPCLFLRQGGKTLSLPVNDRLRQGGTSKFGLKNRLFTGIVDLLGVLWLVRRKTGTFSSLRP